MKIKGDRLCHLCGTHYKEEKGHPASDCWGILHRQLLATAAQVRELEYKLKTATEQMNKAEEK